MPGRFMTELGWRGWLSIATGCVIAAGAACGGDVSTGATSAGGSGGATGAGGAYEPSHCAGLAREACCEQNANGCLWMEFEIGTQTRRGECVGEPEMCSHEDDFHCPDGLVCRVKHATGICGDGTNEPFGACYSPEKWDCPDQGSCTWIGD